MQKTKQSNPRYDGRDWKSEIEEIILKEGEKKAAQMDLDLITEGLDLLSPFNDHEDEERARKSLHEFTARYDLHAFVKKRHRRSKRISLAVAIILTLLFGTGICYALRHDIWTAVVEWTEEYFQIQFSGIPQGAEDETDENNIYDEHIRSIWGDELCDALNERDIFVHLPSWKPEEFELLDIKHFAIEELQQDNTAIYKANNNAYVTLTIRSVDMHAGKQLQYDQRHEADIEWQETYIHNNTAYYFTSNMLKNSMTWYDGNHCIIISGDLSTAQIMDIIHSIQ